MSDTIIKAGSRYGQMLVLCVIINLMITGFTSVTVVALQFGSRQTQETILNCTDRRRTNSDCQKAQNERSFNLVTGPFATVVGAYTVCADKLNGDLAIRKCVSERLASLDRPR
jgi:hypothetical protein